MRQVFSGWGVALKRKIDYRLFTIYFPHPLLHDENTKIQTSHNVEGLLFMNHSNSM